MADTTKLTIELEVLLRNLNRTLRGLGQVQQRLQRIASIKVNAQQSNASQRALLATQRLQLAQQRLQLTQQRVQQQQQRLTIGTQQLANAQGRAQLATQRLALGQQRLAQAQQRLNTATRGLRASTLSLDQILGRVGGSLRNLGQGIASLGASLSVVLTAPLTALGILATRNAVTLDSLNRGLVAISGSADEASVQLRRLTSIAKLPGIGFQEAIQGSIRLQAVGFSAEEAEKALIQFSNAVALTGGGRDELNRITVQLGQLSSKGKVLAQDLKPIIEAAPAVGVALRQAFGTVNSEDIQALGISTDEFLDKLVKQLGQLPRAAAGARNTFDNFTDSLFRATAALGEGIIPVLTRLIETFEPVIIGLANGFKQLSPSVQTVIVVFGALTAAIGPLLFVFGQFVAGIGGLISFFGRLFTVMQAAIPAINGVTAALTAQQRALIGVGIAAGGLVAIIAVVATIATTLALLSRRQKEAIQITKEQLEANQSQINSLKNQIKFLDGLEKGVSRTADEQARLNDIYLSLNEQARIRVSGITDEVKRTAQLREELQRLLVLRNEERVQQAANLAASLADTAAQIQDSKLAREAIIDQVTANTQLADTIRTTGRLTAEQARSLERLGLGGGATAEQAIFALNAQNERLIENQTKLIKKSNELNGTAEEQGQTLALLVQQTGLSTRQLLTAAKAMGVFKGDVEATLPVIERFIDLQQQAAAANSSFEKSIKDAGDFLIKSAEQVENVNRRNRQLIESAATLARSASTSFEGAVKFMKAFIAANPALVEALEAERLLAGKSLDEIIADALTKGSEKGATRLRDAQQRLADQLVQVTQARTEKETAIAAAANEEQLQGLEILLRKQLVSYRQYLQAKEAFTIANIDKELAAEQKKAKDAREAQIRLLAAAKQAGIEEAERVKRLAQAAEQEEKAIQAETKAVELESQRRKATLDFKQALAEAGVQQVADIRQLQVEYGQLTGRIEDALNTATDERFREALQDLGKTQRFLNEQLTRARQKGDKELQAELETAIALNQTQIEATQNIITQERALNQLVAANEFVRRAKEKQAELERDLALQVQFRGLREEDAIAARLEGERKLADSLRVVRDLTQATVDGLTARGLKPPQQLLDFIRDLKGEMQGLGELPFSEQFRLVENEFNRLNDERLRKIEDVERAVRERDIAEVEGMLIIRRINGLYAADLEQQLVLLKQIAADSKDADLQRQAQSAEQTVNDANEKLADFNRQLRSTSIDALRDGFVDFFRSLRDNTISAQEKLLGLVDSVVGRIEEVIAEHLADQLIESIFGVEGKEGGLIAGIKRLFGFGDDKAGVVGAAAGKATESAAAATALTTGATAAASAIATGGAAAGAALTAGGTAGGTGFATVVTTAGAGVAASITTAATSFSAAIISAAQAFAAIVVSAASSQSASNTAGLIGNFARGDLISPRIGGRLAIVAEGGYPEAVLTTDPKHFTRQLAILKAYIAETRGLGGRIKGFAAGGFMSPSEALSGIGAAPMVLNSSLADIPVQGNGPTTVRIRQTLVDPRTAADWLNTPEGERGVMTVIEKHRSTVRRLTGN